MLKDATDAGRRQRVQNLADMRSEQRNNHPLCEFEWTEKESGLRFYDDLNVKLVRPAGDMLGLHSEFLPASKRYINDYVQYVKSDFLAGLGFGATQQLGETTGIYMGYSVDTGRNVYLQPSLASQGVKGTVTNALASAFVGSLGGGKSFCNNLLVYYADRKSTRLNSSHT